MTDTDPFRPTHEKVSEILGYETSRKTFLDITNMLAHVSTGIHAHGGSVVPNAHTPTCWSWGPGHYRCAYDLVQKLIHEQPPMPMNKRIALRAESPISQTISFEVFSEIVRLTERFHGIGGE